LNPSVEKKGPVIPKRKLKRGEELFSSRGEKMHDESFFMTKKEASGHGLWGGGAGMMAKKEGGIYYEEKTGPKKGIPLILREKGGFITTHLYPKGTRHRSGKNENSEKATPKAPRKSSHRIWSKRVSINRRLLRERALNPSAGKTTLLSDTGANQGTRRVI